jgi:AraC-like DNA-binding protein
MPHEPSAEATDGVSLRYFLPAPELRSAISTYYVLRIQDGPVEDLLHPEWANLRLLLSGDWSIVFDGAWTATQAAPAALISGALSKGVPVRCGPGLLVGAGIMPSGWARLSRQSAAGYADNLRPLSDLVGSVGDQLLAKVRGVNDDDGYCAVLDDWFRAQLAPDIASDTLLEEAHRALLDPDLASVADWARRIGRSPRQLERLTLDYFGISPKRLLRRQRFLRTFAALRDEPMGGWGRQLDERYEDQPQFIREFRHFMGMTPKAYFSRRWPFMLAATRARQALLGVAMQSLHRGQ